MSVCVFRLGWFALATFVSLWPHDTFEGVKSSLAPALLLTRHALVTPREGVSEYGYTNFEDVYSLTRPPKHEEPMGFLLGFLKQRQMKPRSPIPRAAVSQILRSPPLSQASPASPASKASQRTASTIGSRYPKQAKEPHQQSGVESSKPVDQKLSKASQSYIGNRESNRVSQCTKRYPKRSKEPHHES